MSHYFIHVDYSHYAQRTSVCSHTTIMLGSQIWLFVSHTLLVEGNHGLMHSLCVCVCLFMCLCVCARACFIFSSTGTIQWKSDFLRDNSLRGSSGSQSVLTFVNTSMVYEHNTFIPLHRNLILIFAIVSINKSNDVLLCILKVIEKHSVNVKFC